MCAATTQLLNYSEQESKKQFPVHDSETTMTFKQGQGHHTQYELVGQKQD